jgi:predicted Zn-ribbon and HTH transcriptional regulator
MKSTDADSPQGQMISGMYGEGFDYQWALVDGLCVSAMGGDVNSAIHEMIDQVKAGGPKEIGAEVKTALGLLPEANKADFVATYNLLRLFRMIATMAPMPMPQMEIPTKSNIIAAGKVGRGRVVVDVAVPKEHLAEVMGGILMMQQQMMMQPQQGQTRPTPRSSGIESISEEDMTWVICNNPSCKAEHQIGKREYYRTIQKRMEPTATSVPALVCEKCGQESLFRAEKCGECGLIFARGSVANDFADRCPKCGYSQTEEQRKRRLKTRQPEQPVAGQT